MSSQDEEQKILDSTDLLADKFAMPDSDSPGIKREADPEPEFVTKTAAPRTTWADKVKAAAPKSKPEPQVEVAGVTLPATSAQEASELKILHVRLHEMDASLQLLLAGRDGVRLRAANIERKIVDWTKLKEQDIFDLSVPIEIVDHDMPDYMRVEPKDSNFVLRWVFKMGRRLGPMKAKGFQFAMPEDIEGDLNIAMEIDANGRIQFDDVILMKCEKRLYFGMLRKNHERAVRMVNPKLVHQEAKARVEGDMRSGTMHKDDPDAGKLSVATGAFDHYANNESGQPKLNVYIPGEI